LEKFVDDSTFFLRGRNHHIRYYDANVPIINLLSMIPTLTYRLKEHIFIGFNYDELWEKIISPLYDIEEDLESVSVNITDANESIQQEIEHLWHLLHEVYKELQNVLDCNSWLDFDFEEKMEVIQERRDNRDYYSEDEDY
jgi:hypothetical protein